MLVVEFLRLVAAASLTAFANTAMTASRATAAGRVAPGPLRRAVAFIDANAGEPITGVDIAHGAGIGLRAMQEGFRRHLGTTPTAYLRRVRLERAHRDLQAADPAGGGVTVSVIARRYRDAFGRPPGHTLRTPPP